MTTANSDIVTGAINRGVAARIAAKASGGVLRIFLIVVGVFWLIPTFGLLVESLRGAKYYSGGGWWQALAHPAQLTFSNYGSLLKNQG